MKKQQITKSIEQIRAEAAALEAAMEAEYLASLTSDETVASVEGNEDAVDADELAAMQDEDGHTRDLSTISFFRDFE